MPNSPVPLAPVIPFVWPEPRQQAGLGAYPHSVPFEASLRSATALFGVVCDFDAGGVSWLQEVICDSPDKQARLLVALYPACATHSEDLQALRQLQEPTLLGGSAKFRLATTHGLIETPANMLCWRDEETAECFVAFGPTSGFGTNGYEAAQANLVFRADSALWQACCQWFDFAWGHATPLTAATAAIPRLVPATGTPEAAAQWEAYVTRCRQTGSEQAENAEQVEVDAATGMVRVWDAHGQETSTATASILPPADALAVTVARIYAQGELVTVDKTTRLKPFDTPIDPRWFGMDSFRHVGSVTRRVSYRISPFEERTLRELNRLRNRIGDVLPKFTFALGDGVRWMPTAAKTLFAAEMERAEHAGSERFQQICGTEPEAFVAKQMAQIVQDANRMYQDFFPNQTLGEPAIQNLVGALSERLCAAGNSSFTPKVSFAEISFRLQKDAPHTSAWGQALTLLYAIAQFPRQVVSDRHFLMGLDIREETLLAAMNVADDAFVRDIEQRGMARRAESELALLDDIIKSEAAPNVRCEAVVALMQGRTVQEIEALLPCGDAAARRL